MRKKVEAGELEPEAKEILLLITQEENPQFALVRRWGLDNPLDSALEDLSEEERAGLRQDILTYLEVRRLLGCKDDPPPYGDGNYPDRDDPAPCRLLHITLIYLEGKD